MTKPPFLVDTTINTNHTKWTKRRAAAAIVTAFASAIVSDCISEFKIWQKVSAQMETMEEMAEWNRNFRQGRGSSKFEEHAAYFKKEYPGFIASGSAKVSRNKRLGLAPWFGLNSMEQVAILGWPAVSLGYADGSFENVYFDANLAGIPMSEISTHSTYLSELSPEVQSVAHKFHLQESAYIPGIYALDPLYYHEHIFKKTSQLRPADSLKMVDQEAEAANERLFPFHSSGCNQQNMRF